MKMGCGMGLKKGFRCMRGGDEEGVNKGWV
jgi:hypothetical protein